MSVAEKLARYYAMNYKTPHDLKNAYAGKKFLVIGGGYSVSEIIPHKNCLKNKFDVIMGLNGALKDFEKEMDIFLAVEKSIDDIKIIDYIKNRGEEYKKDIKHFITFRAIQIFPNTIDIYKINRHNFNLKPNIKEYKIGNQEGLLVGPLTPEGLSEGTIMAQAIHLAAILGASEIYLIGSELLFKGDKSDHYYDDNLAYRNYVGPSPNKIVDTIKDKKTYKSIEFFVYSAKFIDKLVKEDCKNAGIKVYDFSNGLLQSPIKLNVKDFFDGGK